MSAQKISIFNCCSKALIAATSSKHLNKGRSGRCFFLFTSSQTSWLISYPLAKIQRKHLDEKQGNTNSSAYTSRGIKSSFPIIMAKTVAIPVHPHFQCEAALSVALLTTSAILLLGMESFTAFPNSRCCRGCGFFLLSFHFWTSVEAD